MELVLECMLMIWLDVGLVCMLMFLELVFVWVEMWYVVEFWGSSMVIDLVLDDVVICCGLFISSMCIELVDDVVCIMDDDRFVACTDFVLVDRLIWFESFLV